MECYESARAASIECLYRAKIGSCRKAAGCKTHDEPVPHRGHGESHCGLRCFEAAKAAGFKSKGPRARGSGGTSCAGWIGCGAAWEGQGDKRV